MAENVTKFLARMRENWNLAVEEESENREKALDDLKFRAGDQWDGLIKSKRDLDKRPCLTINQLPQFIRQVTNEQRQNRPAIQVNPTGGDATVETAHIFQGMIRHIEFDSNADVAYDTAGQSAVTSGIGWFRIITDYEDHTSFDQVIKFKRVRNPFMVYADPSSTEPDGSDMNWCFVSADYSKEMFEQAFRNSKLTAMSDWESVGDQMPGWVNKEGCRVVEYFYREWVEKTLLLMHDGTTKFLEDIPEDRRPTDMMIKKKRTASVPQIKWCKTNGIEILDETEWPGIWIPIIPVLGDELDVNGERILEGIVRHAKDPVRMYNYWVSAETEMIALSPKAPFIGAAGQFEGFEDKWNTANDRNYAYLEYNPKSVAGTLLGAPQRNQFEAPIQAINHARMASRDDLKATTGIYASGLGEQGNEQTGRAILARQHQGQVSNFHYIDNMTRAIRHAGRILVDLIPKIYDTERIVRIIEPDGNQKLVTVGPSPATPGPAGPGAPGAPPQAGTASAPPQNPNNPGGISTQTGVERIFDLSVGKYDVTVGSGPSYQTKRQEALASLLQLTQNFPKLMDVAGDIIVGNMDWEGSTEIANRLKKTLPPGLGTDDDGNQEMPPQALQKIQQMQQMIEQQTAELHALSDAHEEKESERRSKEFIELAKLRNNLTIAAMQMDQKDAHKLFDTEAQLLDTQMQQNHEKEMLEMQQEQQETQGGGTPGGPASPAPQDNQSGANAS